MCIERKPAIVKACPVFSAGQSLPISSSLVSSLCLTPMRGSQPSPPSCSQWQPQSTGQGAALSISPAQSFENKYFNVRMFLDAFKNCQNSTKNPQTPTATSLSSTSRVSMISFSQLTSPQRLYPMLDLHILWLDSMLLPAPGSSLGSHPMHLLSTSPEAPPPWLRQFLRFSIIFYVFGHWFCILHPLIWDMSAVWLMMRQESWV